MNKLEPRVFISHSSIDDSVARHLEDWLTRLGFACWAYYQDYELDLYGAIQRAIESHDFFLLVSSRNAYEKSIEVEKEIKWAHKKKRQICIYKLDDYAFPQGIDLLLIGTKWVEASNHGADAFVVLAKQMLTSLGHEDDAINQLIIKIRTDINTQLEEEAKRKQLQLEKWLDRLWTYRYDCERKKSRSLNVCDKGELKRYGNELGIDEEDRTKFLRQYKRDLRSFKTAISRALNNNKLDRRDIKELEQARLKFCIPLKEAKRLIQEELSRHSEINALTKGAATQESWLISVIKDYYEVAGSHWINRSGECDCLIENLPTPSPHDSKSTADSSHQTREADQCTSKAHERDQVSQSSDATRDDIKTDRARSKNLLEIERKCHMLWTIGEGAHGKCWLRRIEKRADSLYFWGLGHDLSLALQDIQSVLVNGSAVKVQLSDEVSRAEINCFNNEVLSADLINCLSSQGIQIVYLLDTPSSSVQADVSDGWQQVDSCATDVLTQAASKDEMLTVGSDSSSLWDDSGIESPENVVDRIIGAFDDADTDLFTTLTCYTKDHRARAKALRNHGLQRLVIQDIFLFVNSSMFRRKTGILVCDCLLSISELFEKPVHFDLFDPMDGLLAIDAAVSDDAKITLVVKRETCQGDGMPGCKIIQAFNIHVPNSALTSPFHKELFERELPALVHHLALIRKRSLEVY
jgi:hypothetical protein